MPPLRPFTEAGSFKPKPPSSLRKDPCSSFSFSSSSFSSSSSSSSSSSAAAGDLPSCCLHNRTFLVTTASAAHSYDSPLSNPSSSSPPPSLQESYSPVKVVVLKDKPNNSSSSKRKGEEEDEDRGFFDSLRKKWSLLQPFSRLLSPRVFYRYIIRVGDNFGWPFMVMLASTYIGLKGTLHGFLTRVQLPYYRRTLNMDVVSYQTASAVAQAPWAMKGAIGALSDGWPLFGYHKRPYIIMAVILGTCAVLVLALLPVETAQRFSWLPAVMFGLGNLHISTVDLLCEGKYAELMMQKPQTGADIVTFVWMAIMAGKILSASLVGPISDYVGVTIIFWMALPVAAQSLLPVLFGYLPETLIPPPNRFTPQFEKICLQKKLFFLSILMASAAFGLVIVALTSTPLGQFIYSLAISIILTALSFLWMDRLLALCNLYMFLQDILHPFIGGALDFWYTADQKCVPNGPEFSFTYYSTWTALVGILASFIGLIFFQVVVSKWTFRSAFWVTTAVRVFASVFDLIIIKRWNLLIGIPDGVLYMFGDAVILDIVEMLNFMPSVVLISKLCPKSMESTVYAILAGFANLGATVSKSIGVFAIKAAGIQTEKEGDCNFDSLPLLVLICHFILPLVTIPLTFVMIPNKSMSIPLLIDHHDPQSHHHHPTEEEECTEHRGGGMAHHRRTDYEMENTTGSVGIEEGASTDTTSWSDVETAQLNISHNILDQQNLR